MTLPPSSAKPTRAPVEHIRPSASPNHKYQSVKPIGPKRGRPTKMPVEDRSMLSTKTTAVKGPTAAPVEQIRKRPTASPNHKYQSVKPIGPKRGRPTASPVEERKMLSKGVSPSRPPREHERPTASPNSNQSVKPIGPKRGRPTAKPVERTSLKQGLNAVKKMDHFTIHPHTETAQTVVATESGVHGFGSSSSTHKQNTVNSDSRDHSPPEGNENEKAHVLQTLRSKDLSLKNSDKSRSQNKI